MKKLIVLAMVLSVAACSNDVKDQQTPVAQAPSPVTQYVPVPQPQYVQPQQAPVIVQSAPAQNNDGFFTGMLMGHMMSGGGGYGGGTVVNKTVINRTVVASAPRPTTSYRPSTSSSYSYRPSMSSSFRMGRR